MHNRHKLAFSHLLVLMMVISSFQGASAINFSHNMHGEESAVTLMSPSKVHSMQVASVGLMDHLEENVSHTDCADRCNFTFLRNNHAITLLFTRSKIKQKVVAFNSNFSSHYPNQLIRPPKFSPLFS